MLQSDFRGQRLPCLNDASKSAGGARVGEVQVLEDFGDGPFFRIVPGKLFRRQAGDAGSELVLQSLEMTVHRASLTFCGLSVRMLPRE